MSIPVVLIAGVVLACAGLIGVVAAIIGNRLRIGPVKIPGPTGPLERAVVAVLAVVALAAIAPVVVLGWQDPGSPVGAQARQPAQKRTIIPRPPAAPVAPAPRPTVAPPGSPVSSPAPRTATPVAGVATVTAVSVAMGALTGCDQAVSAAVLVSDGPATVSYRVLVNGVVLGPDPRTAVVASGASALAEVTVGASQPGTVTYDVIGPNAVADSKTWTVPPACQPPALGVHDVTVSDNGFEGDCAGKQFAVAGTLTVTAPSGGVDVTYQLLIDGVSQGARSARFQVGDTAVNDVVMLPDPSAGQHSVVLSYSVTGPVPSSAETTLTVRCT